MLRYYFECFRNILMKEDLLNLLRALKLTKRLGVIIVFYNFFSKEFEMYLLTF